MAEFSDPWVLTDDDGTAPAGAPAVLIQVYKVFRSEADDGSMQVDSVQLLPNVECLAIEERVGATPPTAVFRYVFGDDDPASPQNTEQALSTLYTAEFLANLVDVGDELAVLATAPDGTPVWVFDGHAWEWTMDIDGRTDAVVMTAVGIAKMCSAKPIGGAVWRDSADPTTVLDVPTDRVLQLNPGGVGNASPKDADSGDDPFKYPVVMDPTLKDGDNNYYARPFDLAMAVAHLVYLNNPDQAWVRNPKRDDLDALLVAREPKDGVPFDPNDPSTYDAKPFAVSDTPMTDRPWPAVVHKLIDDYGFDVRWPVTSDASGYPVTSFDPFLRQAAEPKPLLLQERGSRFDPLATNLAAAQFARDLSGVVNEWTVVGGLKRYEVSLVLAPLFPMQAGDVNTLSSYDSTDPAFASSDAYDAYRLFGFDEDGSGHYANLSTARISGTATSLDAIFGAPEGDPAVPTYVKRRRPTVGELFKRDTNGKPLRFRVAFSNNYSGPYPAVWDGTGTWQTAQGGFEPLKDRLGVRCTVHNPNHVIVGKSTAAGVPFGSGVAKLVQCLAAPDAENPAVFVRLTCVVEGDRALVATAKRQDTSPVADTIARVIDARDRYQVQTRSAHSEFNAGGTDQTHADDPDLRDDTDAATAEAAASRTASEAGVMGGTATIAHFTTAYELGDRISEIQGRDLGLRTDTGGSGYAPVLPIVVARRWDLDGKQITQLEISDRSAERRRYGLRRAEPASGSLHGAPPPPAAYAQVKANAAAVRRAGFGVPGDS